MTVVNSPLAKLRVPARRSIELLRRRMVQASFAASPQRRNYWRLPEMSEAC